MRGDHKWSQHIGGSALEASALLRTQRGLKKIPQMMSLGEKASAKKWKKKMNDWLVILFVFLLSGPGIGLLLLIL